MPTALQLTETFPSLAQFSKEKGWRCGKSFISYRSKCYRNPKTGKIATKYIINPKTGRKNKVRVGLNYKEYQKARSKAVKKYGKNKRITKLERQYIKDAERLADSTKKKKKRSLKAKIKRQDNKRLEPMELEQSWNRDLNYQTRSDILEESGANKLKGAAAKQRKAKDWYNKNRGTVLNQQKTTARNKKLFDYLEEKGASQSDLREMRLYGEPGVSGRWKDVRTGTTLKTSPNTTGKYIREKYDLDQEKKNKDKLTPLQKRALQQKLKISDTRSQSKADRLANTPSSEQEAIALKADSKAKKLLQSSGKKYTADRKQDEAYRQTKQSKSSSIQNLQAEADKSRNKNLERIRQAKGSNVVNKTTQSKSRQEIAEKNDRLANTPQAEQEAIALKADRLANTPSSEQEAIALKADSKAKKLLQSSGKKYTADRKQDEAYRQTKQDYINTFPGTRKKIEDTYGEMDVFGAGGYYLLDSKDKKNNKQRGVGSTYKEAAYDYSVKNGFSPGHFESVRDAIDNKKDVDLKVLKEYPDAFQKQIIDSELRSNKTTQSKSSSIQNLQAEADKSRNKNLERIRQAKESNVVNKTTQSKSRQEIAEKNDRLANTPQAEQEAIALTADAKASRKSKPQISDYKGYVDTLDRINKGDITADEIRAAALDLRNNEDAIRGDLRGFKKANLRKTAGWAAQNSDKKEFLVDKTFEAMEERLMPPGNRSLSYSMGSFDPVEIRKNRNAALDKKMANWTDSMIQDAAKEKQQAIAKRDKAIADPKSIDDFRTLVRNKGLQGLSADQKRTYEELVTVRNRGERKKKAPKAEAVELANNDAFKLGKTVHSKKGHDVYVASLNERVDRDKYNALNKRAKTLGGYYSRYARDGAIPGFQFRDEETAKKFMGLEEAEGKDKSGDRKAASSNNLRANAEKIIERNEEKLNRDVLRNTARRARMGASMDDDARAEIAVAKTMTKIADAKDKDNIQFLDRLKSATEVRQLSSILNQSLYNAARKKAEEKYPDPDDYYRRRSVSQDIESKPIDDDVIEYAEYPYPTVHKERIRDILAQSENQKGMKLLSNRIRKKYNKVANRDAENLMIFEKPSEIEDLRRLITQGKYESTSKYFAQSTKEELKDYDRINKTLDLKTPYELRAGLREFNRLKSAKASEDPIKARERALIGKKIDGYFPTPKPVVDKMLDLADLKTGQRVLEPSAGKGNISDLIREKVGNDTLQTIEIDRDLSAILDEKGYNNRRDDFLNIKDEEYDRIVMNPPFEKLKDTEHVKNAYDLLAPGGKLVSVMSESPFFQQQKKAKDFRDWLDDKDGYSEKLPQGSFKNSERSTGVNTRLVVIEKPEEERRKRKLNYSISRSGNIVFFAKPCGKGYIGDKETCYTNSKGKVQYTYKINPKTGRRNKVKRKVNSAKMSKPSLLTRTKRALKDPGSFFGRLKENISNVWQDIGDLIYTDDGRYKLRKPDRSSSSKPFRKPDITTARQDLVKKAIAKNPPEAIKEELKPHLTDNQQLAVGMATGAMERDGGFLLADGTGVGKTRTQLATAQTFADKDKKVLIVSKSEVLKPTWNGKKKGVTGSFKDDAEVMGIKTALTKDGSNIKKGQIGLSTYSNLGKLKKSVDKDTVLIFDEAHSFKNSDSVRSKHGKEMMDKAHSVLYATATPADKPGHLDYLERANVFNGNSPKEIYNWMGLESYSVKKGEQYVQRYRAKKGVKPESVVNKLNGLFDQMTENGNTLKREISLKGVEVGFADMRVSRETRKKMSDIAKIYKDNPTPLGKAQMLMQQRRQLEADKVPAAKELVQDAIARGRKPIVFVSRVNESTVGNDEISITSEGTAKLLKDELKKAGIKNISEIHGGSKKKPADEMNDFQTGKNDVVIATIESGGTGINLDDRDGDKPRSLIVLTPPFSAVENVQAAGRVWRLKTKSYPEIDYVFSNTKVDKWNKGIISNKMQSLGAIVSGETGKLDVSDRKLINQLSDTSKKSPRPPSKKKKKRKVNYSAFKTNSISRFYNRKLLNLILGT